MADAPRPAQPTNELREFLGMLSRRRRWVVLPTLAGVAVGLVLARVLPKTYVAQTQLTVRPDTLRTPGVRPLAAQDELNTIQAEIKSDSLLTQVLAEDVDWPEYAALPDVAKRAFLLAMKQRIGVRLNPKWRESGADVVEITYEDSDGNRAAVIANAIRRRWVEDVRNKQRLDVEGNLQRANKDLEARRNEYDTAKDRERRIREQFGLPLKRETGRDPTQDPAVEEHERLRRDRDALWTELVGLREQIVVLKDSAAKLPPKILNEAPPPTEDPALKGKFDEIDAKVEELRRQQGKYKPLHTEYGRIQREIDRLQGLREDLLEPPEAPRAAVPVPNPTRKAIEDRILSQEEREKILTAQLADRDRRLEEAREAVRDRYAAYAELLRYVGDTEIARERYDDATKRASDLGGLLNRIHADEENPFIDLQDAWAPMSPVSPDVGIVVGLAIFFGLGAGLLLAAMREYGGTGLRTMDDAVRSLSVPVLGAVQWVVTEVERRRMRRRRFVTIGATSTVTLLLVALVLYYVYRPEDLPAPLTNLLDSIRNSLRL